MLAGFYSGMQEKSKPIERAESKEICGEQVNLIRNITCKRVIHALFYLNILPNISKGLY